MYLRALNAGSRVLEFGNGSGGDNVALVLAANSNGPPAVMACTNRVGSSVSAYSPLPLNTWVHLAAILTGNTACIHTNG